MVLNGVQSSILYRYLSRFEIHEGLQLQLRVGGEVLWDATGPQLARRLQHLQYFVLQTGVFAGHTRRIQLRHRSHYPLRYSNIHGAKIILTRPRCESYLPVLGIRLQIFLAKAALIIYTWLKKIYIQQSSRKNYSFLWHTQVKYLWKNIFYSSYVQTEVDKFASNPI